MAILDVQAPKKSPACDIGAAKLGELLDLVAACLTDDSNVIKCAAAQVMAALGGNQSAEALVALLLDADPDVRVDAMAALVRCARLQDADAILESLAGDPEPDVKRSAIRTLARLKHGPSLPLIASLAADRSEDLVAWQDDTIGWDEWNDIQPEAIEAVGEFGSEAMVSTLREVHAGEGGADLEPLIFGSLAKIPGTGIQALVDHASTTVGKTRARAIAALMQAGPRLLAPLIPALKTSGDQDGRLLAIHALADDRQALADLAVGDPSATVRLAALMALCPLEPAVAMSALADEDEAIRAMALDQLRLNDTDPDNPDLVANVEAWATAADARLACACADFLGDFPGSNSLAVLIELAGNADRPQEARLSALRALGGFDDRLALDTLETMAVNPVRQIRLASLTAMAAIAKSDGAECAERAADSLCRAMAGTMPAAERADVDGEEEGDDLAAPKIEGRSSGRITITPDGDIVDVGDEVTEPDDMMSTLDAIQATPAAPTLQEPLEPSKKRGRRVAVDGPDDVSTDVRVLAFSVSGDCPGRDVSDAIADGLQSDQDQVQLAAFNAIARRADSIRLERRLRDAVIDALTDPNPFIRGKAAHAVSKGAINSGARLNDLVDDEDAITRSIAVAECAISDPAIAIRAMGDPSPLVRDAALSALIAAEDAESLSQGLAESYSVDATDTLTQAANRSPVGRSSLISCLSDADRSTRGPIGGIAGHCRNRTDVLALGNTSCLTGEF